MLTPRFSRAALAAGALLACLSTASPARAQFANHSIGVEAGAIIIGNPAEFGIGSGGGLGLNATLYIESGFDLYFRALVSINNYKNVNVVGVLPAIGFRYLISEDTIRPYLGLSVGYLAFFQDNANWGRFALSPMAGIEFFVADNFSIGLQAEYNLMAEIVPAFKAEHAGVILARFNWYF